MIMSCLAFKNPLPPDQIGISLNEQLLPNEKQLREQNQVDEFFEMCDSEFEDKEDDLENSEEETKGNGLRDLGDDIEEEP